MGHLPHGVWSRELFQRLAPLGSDVSLWVQTTGGYGRTVSEVLRGNENINLSIVRQAGVFAFQRFLA